MPFWAASSLPIRCPSAPEKAPRSWPNNSDSSNCSGIAAQLTAMNGPLARWRSAVNVAGDHFLPGAGFAVHQDGGVGPGDTLRALHHGGHRGIAIDQTVTRRRGLASGRKGRGNPGVSLGLQQAAFQIVWNQKVRGGVGGHVSDPT